MHSDSEEISYAIPFLNCSQLNAKITDGIFGNILRVPDSIPIGLYLSDISYRVVKIVNICLHFCVELYATSTQWKLCKENHWQFSTDISYSEH